MPDLTSKLLPRLQTHTLPGLDIGDNVIHPKYADQSILNIPSSVCRWMNVPELGAGPLTPEILSPLGNGIRRVILILMDALALHRLQGWMSDGTAPIWQSLVDDGLLAPLTSVVPSTTNAALTTLWTGRSPAAHGIVGYEMWLKEYGMVANMISHAPMAFRGDTGGLERAGFEPEKFLNLPTLGSHLHTHGVAAHAFQHYAIANSGLSRMFLKDVDIHPFRTPTELWVNVRQLIESKPRERMYIWTYWGILDGLSHSYGPDDERAAAEFTSFSAAFEQFFLNRLSPEIRKDTLVILTADHGQIHTPIYPSYSLSNHPELTRQLHIMPTGENRLAYLFTRPGQRDAVIHYFESVWEGQFALISPEDAVDAGLFGPGNPHPDLRDRLGDLIVVAKDSAYLWWDKKEDFLLGRHGGLHPEDMLVPFLAVRL